MAAHYFDVRSLSTFLGVVTLLAGAGVASASPVNVAILSATGSSALDSDVIARITADASFLNITAINVAQGTATPDPDLSPYAAVMVIGNLAFADGTGLGNELDAYLNSGHGVIIAAYANYQSGFSCQAAYELCGSFWSSDDYAIEPGNYSSLKTHPTLGTVHVPNSPLMTNVTSLDGGSSTVYINGAVSSNATDIADWSDGTPLIATKLVGSGTVVGLNLFPPSNLAASNLWVSTTSGGQIMADAFAYASDYQDSSSSVPEADGYMLSGIGLAALSLLLKKRARRNDTMR